MEAVTYKGCVYPWQCDQIGHMNIMWYAGKFDEANWNLLARVGLTPAYFRNERRGMVAVQQNITYKREFIAGDIVEIHSRFLEVRDKVLRYVHEMCNAQTGEIAAICELTVAHIDRQARKAVPLPAAIRDSVNGALAQDDRKIANERGEAS